MAEKRAKCSLCKRTSTKWYPVEMAVVGCDVKMFRRAYTKKVVTGNLLCPQCYALCCHLKRSAWENGWPVAIRKFKSTKLWQLLPAELLASWRHAPMKKNDEDEKRHLFNDVTKSVNMFWSLIN